MDLTFEHIFAFFHLSTEDKLYLDKKDYNPEAER